MASNCIVKPEEFMIVRHSYLNGNSYDVEQSIEQTLELEKHTNGRSIVPCFEGDIMQIKETGEVVLTHQNFVPLSQKRYQHLREKSLAAPLEEVLDKIAVYRQTNPNQKVVLCFEPKAITTEETIDKTIAELKSHGIEDAYFDSFFGAKLDMVDAANQSHGTDYQRSLHAIGNISSAQLHMTRPRQGYDVLTVPKTLSVGHPQEPVIYGAVSSADKLEAAANDPTAIGAYVRFKENALKMLWNSVTNTENLRKITVLTALGTQLPSLSRRAA